MIGLQIAQVVRSALSILFIAVILGHIYIGTLGMEGAFEAMAKANMSLVSKAILSKADDRIARAPKRA